MATRNDSFLFKDETVYPYYGLPLSHDLYSIYSNARIVFELPNEMFWNDYIRYRDGIISIDEFINEIERKTDMYMNE